MASILDFAKWTLALAIALIFWLEATFLPAERGPVFWIVLATMAVAAASALVGVGLYERATKVLAQDAKATFDDDVRRLGVAHSALLLAAMVGAAGLFAHRVLQPPAGVERCAITANGVTLAFDCTAELAGVIAE